VYAGWAILKNERFPAAIVVGARRESPVLVEAHIIGWSGDLYDAEMTLEFEALVSGIKPFTTIEKLQQKISQDIIAVKKVLHV
jgi:riboflavin kinase/FMN adenylyltransferase